MAYVVTDIKPPNLRHFMETLIAPHSFNPALYDDLVIRSCRVNGRPGIRAVHAIALDSTRRVSPPLAIFDRRAIGIYKIVVGEIEHG